MKHVWIQILLLVLFVALSAMYFFDVLAVSDIDKTFLTLSTFLFALFTGFFISRQATRYSDIRKLTADFDGVISSIYRFYSHYSVEAQNKLGEIIKNHYKAIADGGWDYHIQNKSTTLTDIHNLTRETINDVGTDGIKGAATSTITRGLHEAQRIRKNMVALHDERIPGFQFTLIYILTAILVVTVSTVPSVGLLLGSLVKAAFIVSVLVVVILLKKLDNLELFSGMMGEKSAQDVINIIKGVR